ncbi:uncharacterized protein [Petaurus breviceps papuanus]|uniref:uncharacterized protein isoform X2 n=1 Tax=Petaurus breviceps papuanus TaxID=3040969 RepID=UPI0036D9817F
MKMVTPKRGGPWDSSFPGSRVTFPLLPKGRRLQLPRDGDGDRGTSFSQSSMKMVTPKRGTMGLQLPREPGVLSSVPTGHRLRFSGSGGWDQGTSFPPSSMEMGTPSGTQTPQPLGISSQLSHCPLVDLHVPSANTTTGQTQTFRPPVSRHPSFLPLSPRLGWKAETPASSCNRANVIPALKEHLYLQRAPLTGSTSSKEKETEALRRSQTRWLLQQGWHRTDTPWPQAPVGHPFSFLTPLGDGRWLTQKKEKEEKKEKRKERKKKKD